MHGTCLFRSYNLVSFCRCMESWCDLVHADMRKVTICLWWGQRDTNTHHGCQVLHTTLHFRDVQKVSVLHIELSTFNKRSVYIAASLLIAATGHRGVSIVASPLIATTRHRGVHVYIPCMAFPLIAATMYSFDLS